MATTKTVTTVKTIVATEATAKHKWGVSVAEDLPGTVKFAVPKPFEPAAFYTKLRSYLSKQRGTNVIDADTFIAHVGAEHAAQVVKLIEHAAAFVSVTPFTRKTTKPELPKFTVKLDAKYSAEAKEARVVAGAITLVRELQDTPSDSLWPDVFAKRFEKEAKGLKNVKVTILDKKALVAKKMGMLLGVNKGSKHEAKLLVIEYTGAPSSKAKFAYVGKGICFDSGGMNLKTGGHMRTMKYDMSGAAIVCATVLAAACNKVKANLVAVAPLTENLLSNEAQRPDDIVTAYNGLTVEIDNTDAEGRLVLGDAIAYAAKDLKATRIFDVATLTGAMIYALGSTFTGCWSTSDSAWKAFAAAAKAAAEPVWRMPLHEDFDQALESKLADVVNCAKGPGAGSSTAAAFLCKFREGVDLVHLDIAATAGIDGLGQGVMVRALYEQAKEFDA